MRSNLALAICCVLGATAGAAAQPSAGDRYLVIPFDNPGRETGIYWLGEGSAVLLADDLNALGRRSYTREERLEVFQQLQVPPITSLSHATVIRLGQLAGATHVVIGTLQLASGEITARARNIRLDTGRMESEVVESGPLDNLFPVFERVARRLTLLAADGPALGRKPPLAVFENYIKGLLAAATPAKVGFLQSALKLDPSFDRARLALWAVHQDQGNPEAAMLAAAAVPEASQFYSRARFSVALSLIELKRLDDAFTMLKALGDRAPSAAVMNNLGVIQLRRTVTPQTGPATYYFSQAVKLGADDPDYYFNLGYAYWAIKDVPAALFWLREAVRRYPADGEAHAVLAAALQATGATTEAGRERELATQLSSTYAEWARRPAGGELVPRGLERLKPSLDAQNLRRLDVAIATTELREQRELSAFHLDRGRRFVEQGGDVEAIGELRRVLYLSPYEAEAHLLLGRVYLRTGQSSAAIDAFKISLWSQESVGAHVALAQAYIQTKNEAAARGELQRALVIAPNSTEAKELLSKLKP